MPQRTIQPQLRSGVINTPDVLCPNGMTAASVQVTMPNQSDRDNPLASMEIRLEFSADGGTTWKSYMTCGWVGGSGYVDKQGTVNPPPNMTLTSASLQAMAGQRVRIGFTIPVPITVGCVISAS